MKALLTTLVFIASAGAGYLAGYLREHARLAPAEAQIRTLTGQVAEARALLRVHALHDEVESLAEEVGDPARYSRAQTLSTQLFDDVREQVFASSSPQVKQTLGNVLDLRDQVTTALAKRDPAVRELLRKIRTLLHPLLLAGPDAVPQAAEPAREGPPKAPGATGEPANRTP